MTYYGKITGAKLHLTLSFIFSHQSPAHHVTGIQDRNSAVTEHSRENTTVTARAHARRLHTPPSFVFGPSRRALAHERRKGRRRYSFLETRSSPPLFFLFLFLWPSGKETR